MVQFNFTYDPNISLEQRVGFELAAMIWSSYLTDDVTVNLHIASSDSLGEGGEAVGGAIPIFHEQNYGIYQEYAEADASSDTDEEAIDSLQDGNTVDLLVDDQVVDGNTDILITSAQAKALGMDEAITLDNGRTWDRDLVDPDGLDGYIIVSNAFDWNYDYTRSGEAPEGTLDFMSMALHEIGHQLGFVSSLDGTLDIDNLHSGETQAEGFTVLDLFRHSIESTEVENPDGAVSDLTLGQNSYFSIDGGDTNLGDFADGLDYQASHWKRLQVAMGIMDPTLAYQERLSLGHLDLQAMDVLGWDINYNTLETGLDLDTLLTLAENKVEASLGLSDTALDDSRGGGKHGDMYNLGYSQWWAIFEKHILELGYSQWWSVFELGYSQWWQQHEEGTLELGYSQWWQSFEDTILELGYSQWWQSFEADMLELGYSQWWQLLELGYSQWWQKLDTYFSKLDKVNGNVSKEKSKSADGGVAGIKAKVYRGGENDDIIAGDHKQDRINAGEGDDLVDGKGGHDVIWGEAGEDILYGQDGNDLVYGGDDDDLLLGEKGDDELHGDDGHDILSGGQGDDILSGDDGRDDLKGGWGKDVLDGGDGDDRLEGEANNDVLIGGKGQDQINGGSGDDVIYGDSYNGSESLTDLRKQLQEQSEENTHASDTSSENGNVNPLRVEAESMTLTGDYTIQTTWNNDSGDTVGTDTTTTATATFSGESGQYMVLARYFDEDGGTATLDFGFKGNSLTRFNLDQNTERYYTQTVAQNITLNTGDEFTVTATANGSDNANFDYLEFVSLDNLIVTELKPVTTATNNTLINNTSINSYTNIAPSSENPVFRVEAEAMTLLGDYEIESSALSSGNALIAVADQGEGKALTTFAGEAGYYNIVVGYHDENDEGIGQLSTALNGTTLDTWSLDQALGSSTLASRQNFLTRTVASTVYLNAGDIFELTGLRGEATDNRAIETANSSYSDFSTDELARIDYVDFVKVDLTNENPELVTGSNPNSAPTVTGEPIRIEAESMNLAGYSIQSKALASNSGLIKTNSSGTANTSFNGDTGYYNIVVAYYDENDGLATISASLDGVELDSWQLDQNLGTGGVQKKNLVTRTIATQIRINTGDELQLEGIRQYNEHARIDYVEFVPVSEPASPMTETNEDDFLQGGAGNDTIYAGQGNDTLYGESANDNTSNLLRGSHTFNGHTYLISELGTWEEAQLQAQQLGGNLVTLNTAEEEDWVRNTFSTSERLWTGFSDAVTEGEWQWVSGESVTYTNWAPGEPNDVQGGQDFGTINYNNRWDDTQINGYASNEGWQEGIRGVIEITTTNNDILVGGSGEDTLYGNSGDDVLYGDTVENGSALSSSLSNGLVGYWALDETTGTRAQNSAGGNEGILGSFSDSGWTSGSVGGALNFSGTTGDTVVVADYDALDITQDLTVSTWVKVDNFENWDGLITKGTSQIPYGLSLMSDGRLTLQTNYGYTNGGEVFSSNASLTVGEWQHVAVTYDGSNVRFYIDGQLDSSHTTNITFETNNQALLLGVDTTADAYLDGALDDVRVYDRALSAEDIGQLAAGETNSTASSPTDAVGNDVLYGGIGSDTLQGGAGNDVLDGSDAIAAGYFEKDTLEGGLGLDTFVLGNANQTYYQGGGNRDFATIKDFNVSEDFIQLYGSADNYSFQQQGNDTYLYAQSNNLDLVAVLKNVSNANFNAGFSFV